MDMNAVVLVPAAEIWVEIFYFEASGNSPRVFPLRMVLQEARLFHIILPVANNIPETVSCFIPIFTIAHTGSGQEVLEAHAAG